MNVFFLFFGVFSFSSQHRPKKIAYIPSATNHMLNDVGFYDILIRGGETITGGLSNGNNRLFILIPSHPDISIEEIKIDNIIMSGYSGKRGFIFNGDANATIRMKSSNSKSILQVNAWLIPSRFCPTSAIYTYGNRRMEIDRTISVTDFCIFSPTLDSKNNKFNTEYGIKSTSHSSDGSSLYNNDFSTPVQTTSGTQTSKYESDGPFFIQYVFNDYSKSGTIKYERKTSPSSFKDKSNKCSIDPFYRCTQNAGDITCQDDQTGSNNEKTCTNLLLSKRDLILTATFCSIGFIGLIVGIVLCAVFCSCCSCCCCNKSKKKKVNNKSKKKESQKNSESSSKEKEEEEEEEEEEKKESKFDLYKELKNMYENHEKSDTESTKKHQSEFQHLMEIREVTQQEAAILKSFKDELDLWQRDTSEQKRQMHERQLQALKLYEEMPNSVDIQQYKKDYNDI